ncbi:MAG: helicase-related protein [Pseudomonadota bacterium]
MNGETIKKLRLELGYSQQEFAAAIGVSFATVNRWENGKAKPQKDRIERLRALSKQKEQLSLFPETGPIETPRLNFEGDPDAIKLVIDAYRLQNGHLFNNAFGLELSRVVPLPHQRIAVYEYLLPQNPLRFLLADDAGAGKTIMTGLYIREMINRGRLSRVIICCPAGLTWNWRRELRYFFDLDFNILRGSDFLGSDPFSNSDNTGCIISMDTAATDFVKEHLTSVTAPLFDLVVFDEAHKLSWGDPKRKDSQTRRYRLAEALSTRTTHLLLLTATPHMGKQFPYFALWRLLDSKVFTTPDALPLPGAEKHHKYFLRRLKEEMVHYKGLPIYMPRLCQTISFQLTQAEQHFYEEASAYLRWSYETNMTLNKNAAAMVVAVFQRRLASSTYAMLESLKRRRSRIMQEDSTFTRTDSPSIERIIDHFDNSTADENEPSVDGRETDEQFEDQALDLLKPTHLKQRQKELEYLERVIDLGEKVRETLQEAKFLKLRELIESAEFQNEKILIFTEHRDTLDYLRQRFEALGYTGQIAFIHGGMDVEERELQRNFFMPPELRQPQRNSLTDSRSARIMIATDAAGEGINLQFAWLMVNFDIPWNPARLEQRMGRLHRFGQRHEEVRIFNLVAEKTREGDVLATLLVKLDEARKELCSDKVFDVIGQKLQEVSLRDLLRDALFETPPYSAQKKLDSIFATQKLRATIEEQRKTASTYGDVARRLGQLNNEIEVERFNRLLPAFIQNFIEKATPRVGIQLEGDLSEVARFSISGNEGQWLRSLADHFPDGLPECLTVRREMDLPNIDVNGCAFLRPGEIIFDTLCQETIRLFKRDVLRGAVFCDPAAEKPYYTAVYQCQIGEAPFVLKQGSNGSPSKLLDRKLIGLRWDENGEFIVCAPHHVLALLPAPRSLVWKAGNLLLNPDDYVAKADVHARTLAESTYLDQTRTAFQAESLSRLDDLMRGFDLQSAKLAEERSELSRRARLGDVAAAKELEEVKKEQARLEEDKAEALLLEQRRSDLLEVVKMERIAVALVIPDPSPEAQEVYDKNIEAMAMRISRNFEVDHYNARVFDVSSPHLGRGYDLESHRANGEKVVIEVKGRAGRGPVQLTENEWPTAVNVRDRYWLYVVVDCATNPKIYRVQDPAFKLAVKTRQSFTINIGDVIREAEQD